MQYEVKTNEKTPEEIFSHIHPIPHISAYFGHFHFCRVVPFPPAGIFTCSKKTGRHFSGPAAKELKESGLCLEEYVQRAVSSIK